MNKKTGAVRIVTKSCTKTERTVYVNQQGIPGPVGVQGLSGPRGETGEVGAQGPAGPKGDTGAQGPAGPKGDTGAQGPAGPKGDTGDRGSSGLGASVFGGTGVTAVVKGQRYLVMWSGTVSVSGNEGSCRLSADFGSGATLIDGGVAFATSGTAYLTPAIYNTIKSTTFFVAPSSQVTFSTVCVYIAGSGDESASASAIPDLVVELIPFNE